MKLLYIWMAEGATDYIQNKGLNLSVEHRFLMQTDGEKYKLTHEDTGGYDLWKQGNIIGLTAIIGENGSGKTTLFRSIYTNSLLPNLEKNDEAYSRYFKDQNRKRRCLLIYEFQEENEILVYHNLPSFSNETSYQVLDMNALDSVSRITVMAQLEQQTKVYFTNSNYCEGFDGVNTHGSLNGICLTPSSLSTISTLFYKKISMSPDRPHSHDDSSDHPQERFHFLQSKLCSCKTVRSFQEICDVSFLHSLKGKHQTPLFEQKHTLQISFTDPLGMLRRLDGYLNLGSAGFQSDNLTEKSLSECACKYSTMLQLAGPGLDVLSGMFSALMFELCYVCDLPFPETVPTDWIQSLQDRLEEYQRGEHDEPVTAYYQKGLKEAKALYEILRDCPRPENYLPPTDLAYVKTISVEPGTDSYDRFCEAVDQFAQEKFSVVLKYISISGLTYSSGERALLNLFSWLRLPPLYDKFLSADSISLRDDVLLMIDELDLYMHPEWQRKAMAELKTWLGALYPEKRIQLLIATHSPLVLSDIPKENSSYLKPDERLTFANPKDISQTFGANIHQILNNSFFLDKTKGEYSFGLISEIVKDLETLKVLKAGVESQNSEDLSALLERCREYRKVIELVGEPLIQQKLWAYYLDCFPKEERIELVFQGKIHAMTAEQKERLWPELNKLLEKIGES